MQVTLFEYLDLLIYAGWGDVPQTRLPDDVLASAARAAFPRVAPDGAADLERELKPRPAPIVIDDPPAPPPAWSTVDKIQANFAARRAKRNEWKRARRRLLVELERERIGHTSTDPREAAAIERALAERLQRAGEAPGPGAMMHEPGKERRAS